MFRPRLKTILWLFTIFVTLSIIGLGAALWKLDLEMTEKMQQKSFLHPTEFYAYPLTFEKGQLWSVDEIAAEMTRHNYRARSPEQVILPGDYFRGPTQACLDKLPQELPEGTLHCLTFVRKGDAPEKTNWIFLDGEKIIELKAEGLSISEVSLEPLLIAQYLGNEPLSQKNVELSEIPIHCLNAVLAIEDQNFLEHGGFSVTSFLRAFYKNVITRQRAQGGSTITQQLVKNYFLTNEKTFRRKLQELGMAILLEARFTKDQILETYLNIIYMGQNGAFRVHGFGAAAQYYFQKDLQDLQLSDCALIASILNSPGLFNPWKKSENAKKRRSLVLSKMLEQKMISPEDMADANNKPLTQQAPKAQAQETAPYYLNAVRRFLAKNLLPTEGVRVFTALDLNAQQKAQEALQKHLGDLEKNNKLIKANKEKGLSLEGAVLSGEPQTGLVHVLVGGRNFRMTQFNRAIDGHRQVGSIMKPFVYLAALMSTQENGKPFTPVSLINDEKFTVKYDGQKWSPENYGKKFYGPVPLFFALKNSLNAATAKLGLDVGLSRVIYVAQQLGVTSELKPVPSLTLGAFEIYPTEVLNSYMALSQMGRKPELSFVLRVEDKEENNLYEFDPQVTEFEDPAAIAALVGMMRQTVLTGSARAISASGFRPIAAGKTGTTSDYRDTWFAGFTPDITSVVWVGYDNNEKTGLTGASGAIPIWLETMKTLSQRVPKRDFDWPESVEKVFFSPREVGDLKATETPEDGVETELIFKNGTK